MNETRFQSPISQILPLLSALILFSLVGCLNREPLPEWVNIWLENPKCLPPCWESIIPGTTSIDDAISVLKNYSEFRITKLSTPLPTDPIVLEWRIPESSDNGYVSSGSGSERDSVQVIFLQLNSNFPLNQLVDAYGPPNQVKVLRCFIEISTNMCEIELAYIDLRLVTTLLVNTPYRQDLIIISPNSRISELSFHSPKSMKVNWESCINCTDWKGYGEYTRKGK